MGVWAPETLQSFQGSSKTPRRRVPHRTLHLSLTYPGQSSLFSSPPNHPTMLLPFAHRVAKSWNICGLGHGSSTTDVLKFTVRTWLFSAPCEFPGHIG